MSDNWKYGQMRPILKPNDDLMRRAEIPGKDGFGACNWELRTAA